MKKLAFAALAVLTAFSSINAEAKTWNHAKVTQAGTASVGGIFVKLTNTKGNTDFTDRAFKLIGNVEDIGLAISLAAASSNRQIVIQSNIDEVDDATMPIITSIYLTSKVVTD